MPPKAPRPFSVISWYNGNQVSPSNVSLQNVMHYTDDDLEKRHDFIQLLFPLPWPSKSTNTTVVASVRQYSIIRGTNGKRFRGAMYKSVKKILAMFDLELTPDTLCTPFGNPRPFAYHRGGGRRIRRIKPVEGDNIDHAAREARFQALANPGNHHHRRITRMIRSLRLCARPKDADSIYRFFRRFAIEHPTIPEKTWRTWGVAANSEDFYRDPYKEVKGASGELVTGEVSDWEDEPVKPVDTDDESGGSGPGSHKSSSSSEIGSNDGGGTGGKTGGGRGGGGIFSSSGSSSSGSEKLPAESSDDEGGFGPFGGDSPPPIDGSDIDEEQPPTIGDPRMSDEDIQKLTDPERKLHNARINYMNENRDIEIRLNFRKANGKWIGKDKDPMTMIFIDLRVWQLVLRDLEAAQQAEEAVERAIREGENPEDPSDEASSGGSDVEDPNGDRDKVFTRDDIRMFGQSHMSAENLQKLEPWELELHLALVQHTKDYLEIEVRHKFRNGDGIWRARGADPINMSMRSLREWQFEINKREADWLDKVAIGEATWSQGVESDTSFESEYDFGDPNMSERYFAWLGDEDKERHLALMAYYEKFRGLEYELGYRDRATYEWAGYGMDPAEMNLEELDQWTIEMEQQGDEWIAKQEELEAAEDAAEAAAEAAAAPAAKEVRKRRRSPEHEEAEKLMAARVKMGLDPYGDTPEAKRWKAMVEEMEKQKKEKEEAEREASEGPEDQLRTEEQSAAKRAQTGQETSSSSRSKKRRVE